MSRKYSREKLQRLERLASRVLDEMFKSTPDLKRVLVLYLGLKKNRLNCIITERVGTYAGRTIQANNAPLGPVKKVFSCGSNGLAAMQTSRELGLETKQVKKTVFRRRNKVVRQSIHLVH